MSEQLTIRELAPYLSYKLQVWTKAKAGTSKGKPMKTLYGQLHGLYCEYGDEASVIFREDDTIIDYKLNEIKPLLRPMTDIDIEIEHNGEKFYPMERLKFLSPNTPNFNYMLDGEPHIKNHWIKKDLTTSYIEYCVIKHLAEWHFDFQNLIPRNLALPL